MVLCQWCERMYFCGVLALYVRMFVAGANKVEGTMSWMLRNQMQDVRCTVRDSRIRSEMS